MNSKAWHGVALAALAVVFTVALTFATLEGPRLVSQFIQAHSDVPDLNPAVRPELVEAFMSRYHVRLVGYACLALVAVLIVVGFLSEKTGFSSLGAMAFFLPTFGYFAAYMFFLAGLGLLRALWLPFWGPWLKLGDIAMVPYMAVVYPFARIGVDVHRDVAYLAIVLGLLAFVAGTLAWFYAKLQRQGTARWWPYRFSRHPQYLGWMVWSYGLMLLAAQAPVPFGGQNPGASLPWLISSLVIVCVALGEELSMSGQHGPEYEAYRSSTPFLLPLPGAVSALLAAPARWVLKADRPSKRSQLLVIFLVYAALLMLCSLPFVLLNWPPGLGWTSWPHLGAFGWRALAS